MNRKLVIGGTAIVLMLVLAGVGGYWAVLGRNNDQIAIAESKRRQTAFNGVYPLNGKSLRYGDKDFHYYPDDKLLVLETRYQEGNTRIVLSEQLVADDIKTDDTVFKEFVDSMKQYGEFTSSLGKVFLTKPAAEGGKQTAVLKTDQILVFIRADDDITDEQWRRVVESLRYSQ
jgi:hypothetical protein